jgi:hypothetical protein
VSPGQRIGLIVVAVVILAGGVVAAVVASGGDDGGEQTTSGASQATATTAPTETQATRTEPEELPAPPVQRIRLKGGVPVGGVEDLEVTSGEKVRLNVTSDAADEIHVHGYDLTKTIPEGGGTVRFRFTADREGIFEIESHEAEHQGREPLIAELEVRPE